MLVAAVQYDIDFKSIKHNYQKAEYYIREAYKQGAKLVVLPELWPCGYRLNDIEQIAETSRDSAITLLRDLAKELSIFIVGGSICEKKEHNFYNTCININSEGEIVGKYRKVHLYKHGFNEAAYFKAGNEWVFSEFDDIRLGSMICYDIFFPEFARNLSLRGAELLTLPGQWPAIKLNEWQMFCKVRAIENQCFLIAANCTDSKKQLPPKLSPGGHSIILDQSGHVLAEAGEGEQVILADLDIEALRNLRHERGSLHDRHRILDEIDDSQF